MHEYLCCPIIFRTPTNNAQSTSLRIFNSNVRGILKNWNSIKQIELDKYDILLFNEIWQIKDYENLKIDGFVLANVYQRQENRGGGAIIFIREMLIYSKYDSPTTNGIIESTAILLNNLVIVSIYRPPSGNKTEFVDKLIEWIESQRGKLVYIAGDFNLNYKNNDIDYFRTIEENTECKPCITETTRVISNSCIDNVLTNCNGNHSVSSICIADHQGLISKISVNVEKKVSKRYSYRDMRDENWTKFGIEIDRISITGNNINEKWSKLLTDIKVAVENSFPIKYSKVKYKFEMSAGLLRSKHKKNKLLREYKAGRIQKEVYIRYNKLYRKLIFKEKESNFNKSITECGVDSKKKWRTLKEELKINTNKDEIDKLLVDNNIITDKKDIAKSFRDHFETCALKLADNIPDQGECEILIEQQPEWSFQKITRKDLLETIESLVPKASCGYDLLSNRMIKKEKNRFCNLTLDLINETITNGVFPEVLKIAKVLPIFKKGDKTNMTNYRPISLLPVLSKIVEKVLNKQITNKLDEYHLIDDNQYGFRTEHSTEDAVVKFVDQIERLLPNNKFVISIHIDVSKAFDSCNHEIMSKKLKKIGLSKVALDLMNSYMKDRVQEIWIETECGGRFVINIGVGQGTVLGPTLFKIYIMDMHLATKLFSLRFADDSNFVGYGTNKENTEKEINEELEKLHKWFCKNKLTLHPDKSRVIVYTKEKIINIKLGGKQLMRCGYGLQEEGVKFLGVIIDENLDWRLQMNSVKKKIGKGNYLLWRYKNSLTTGMKKTVYESFVRTHLTYCLPVWGAKKSGALTDLKKTLKRIWSKIGIRRQHTNTRLIEHKILKLEDELKLSEIKIIWRWNKSRLPLGLKDIIAERLGRNLRHRQFIRDRAWKQDSIAYRLATRVRKEIKEIEVARSKKGLVKKYRNNCFLIEYTQPCRIRNCLNCQNIRDVNQ